MHDKRILAFGTGVWWVAAVPGAAMAVMTPMMFDAPGSLDSTVTIAAALALVSFPVFATLCPVLAWLAYARKRPRAALALMCAPVLPLAAIALAFAVIEFGCGGSLVCP